MSPQEIYLAGIQARGEACKHGGTLSTILIGVLVFNVKEVPKFNTPLFYATGAAFILLVIAVMCSAVAFMQSGYAATGVAERHADKQSLLLDDLVKDEEFQRTIRISVISGTIEMWCVLLGFIVTLVCVFIPR